MDYDEISQLKTEGYGLQCVLVDKEGIKENQEEMWGMFLMTFAENVPQVLSDYHIIVRYLMFFELFGYDEDLQLS